MNDGASVDTAESLKKRKLVDIPDRLAVDCRDYIAT